MSRTGVSTGAGAKTRWAGIFAGLWLALIVLMIGEYAELIPMAVIGGLIVVIGVELAWERYADIVLVLRTSWYSSLAMVVTFLATTQIPLQNAIILGAAISILLYCVQAARQASLTALVHDSDGRWHTEDPPDRIEPGSVTVLNYSGVAFFAEVHRIASNGRPWTTPATPQSCFGYPIFQTSRAQECSRRWSGTRSDSGSRAAGSSWPVHIRCSSSGYAGPGSPSGSATTASSRRVI